CQIVQGESQRRGDLAQLCGHVALAPGYLNRPSTMLPSLVPTVLGPQPPTGAFCGAYPIGVPSPKVPKAVPTSPTAWSAGALRQADASAAGMKRHPSTNRRPLDAKKPTPSRMMLEAPGMLKLLLNDAAASAPKAPLPMSLPMRPLRPAVSPAQARPTSQVSAASITIW